MPKTGNLEKINSMIKRNKEQRTDHNQAIDPQDPEPAPCNQPQDQGQDLPLSIK